MFESFIVIRCQRYELVMWARQCINVLHHEVHLIAAFCLRFLWSLVLLCVVIYLTQGECFINHSAWFLWNLRCFMLS
jgi:hypothetical protein